MTIFTRERVCESVCACACVRVCEGEGDREGESERLLDECVSYPIT
jgi:hypothetical protein